MSRPILDHEFYCTKCGKKNPYSIPRFGGKERPAGHLKKIFCLNCQEEHNMVECVPFSKYDKEDFFLEFNKGNFDTTGQRKMPYGLFRDKLYRKGELFNE